MYACAAMIQSSEDLVGYLTRLERPFERAEDGTYVLSTGAARSLVAVRIEPPILVVRAEIGSAPQAPEACLVLYRKLLELNASALAFAAYGLEGARVVLSAALSLDSADLNELAAVLADIDLALAEHVAMLHEMVRS